VEDLAKRTGGVFQAARDAAAVEAVYARIDALEKTPAGEARFETRDAFLGWLLAGLLLLLLGRLLGASLLEVAP
jgi:Ca-activated chloride channel family protein